MKVLPLGVAITFFFANSVCAKEHNICEFLPESKQPAWVNSSGVDDDFYYAVGGASGKQGNSFLEINDFINNAKQDAVNNLASSIRSGIKTSTKRTIESKKEGKSKAEIRKEVEQKTEVVSQVALSAVMDDARWLDTKNCLLWYRVKVSKAGAEFAVKAYVDEVAEQLYKKIDELTKRETEQILSDNGFSQTLQHAVQALLNNSQAYYRGQTYNIAELYQQSGFDWLSETEDSFFMREISGFNSPLTGFGAYYSQNNAVTAVIRSNSYLSKQIHALTQLKSFGIDLNKIRVGAGQYVPAGSQVMNSYPKTEWLYKEVDGRTFRTTYEEVAPSEVKSPIIYNFMDNIKNEKFGLLHFAVISYRADLIKPLIELGLDVNQLTEVGYTPLALAIESGQLSTAKLLIQLNASLKKQDYLAYKIAYFLLHLNKLNSGLLVSSINTSMLKQLINRMKIDTSERDEIVKMILKKYPIEVTITKAERTDKYGKHYYEDLGKKKFINDEEIK